MRHRNLDWFTPNSPEIIIVVCCRFNFYQNLIAFWIWYINVFDFNYSPGIFMILSIYCCFHLYCINYFTYSHIFIGGIKSNQTQNHANEVDVHTESGVIMSKTQLSTSLNLQTFALQNAS